MRRHKQQCVHKQKCSSERVLEKANHGPPISKMFVRLIIKIQDKTDDKSVGIQSA